MRPLRTFWEVEGPHPQAVPWYHTAFAPLFLFVWAFWVTGRTQENRPIVFFGAGGPLSPAQSRYQINRGSTGPGSPAFPGQGSCLSWDSLMPALVDSLVDHKFPFSFPSGPAVLFPPFPHLFVSITGFPESPVLCGVLVCLAIGVGLSPVSGRRWGCGPLPQPLSSYPPTPGQPHLLALLSCWG